MKIKLMCCNITTYHDTKKQRVDFTSSDEYMGSSIAVSSPILNGFLQITDSEEKCNIFELGKTYSIDISEDN